MVSHVAGKLDEISEAIGASRASIAGLERAFSQHCRDDDRRHGENLEALRENSGQIARLNLALAPIAKTVEGMLPILENYQVSRWKRAGAIGLALTMVGFVGWVVQLTFGTLLNFLLHLGK